MFGLKSLSVIVQLWNLQKCICVTPGCMGELIPVKVSSVGLGGAVSIKYNCNGCTNHEALFETFSKYELHNTSVISVAVKGCIHCGWMQTHHVLQNIKTCTGY